MIVMNWPDACPSCGCREFYASNTKAMSKLTDISGNQIVKNTTFKHNLINFNCRDEECGHAWKHQLQCIDDPYVFVHGVPKNGKPPMAVFARDTDEAQALVALHGSWSYYPLRALLKAGAHRVKYVQDQVEAAANADAEGV